MAKGGPSGVYVPEDFTSSEAPMLSAWILKELWRISATFELALVREVEFLNSAPAKTYEGMIRGADGTNWNPGSGQGVYVYYNSTWNKLG